MATRYAIGIHDRPVFNDLIVADTKNVGGRSLHTAAGRCYAGILTDMGAGHDRAKGDQIAFDQDADVLVHVKAQIGKRLPERGVVALYPGPAADPVFVVRQERSCDGHVDARLRRPY